MSEIKEVYKEDTVGRRYRIPTVTKKGAVYREEPPSEVVSLQLNAPMNRDEFKKLTNSLKVVYLQHLRKTYSCTATQVADMLGYHISSFSKMVSRLNQNGLFKRGERPAKKQISEWNKFLKSSEDYSQYVFKPELKRQGAPISMFCNCSFTIKGELNISDISERIRSMVEDGTPCKISIAIDSLSN